MIDYDINLIRDLQQGIRTNLGTKFIVRAISRALQNDQSVEAYLPLADFGVNFGSNYYTYMGSLTTPGCQQIVRWIVSKKIQSIRQSDVSVALLKCL